jgi:hypothetical protein
LRHGQSAEVAIKAMAALGIRYVMAQPQEIGDQCLFWGCRSVPTPLPRQLSVLGVTPEQAGLSAELRAELAAKT